jgi:hypothetical protein
MWVWSRVVKDSGQLQVVCRRPDEMLTVGLDVGWSESQRQRHKVRGSGSPLVHNCGKHDVQGLVPSGQGY